MPARWRPSGLHAVQGEAVEDHSACDFQTDDQPGDQICECHGAGRGDYPENERIDGSLTMAGSLIKVAKLPK